ncbi:unnamed protein product [Spodoptera littoralis]|uniref:Uncharacterized protein n=1 Tax=Spodoptera littoralis TaxID=7109 RepID=A0A9P0N100_SPOLI|nr:unnamed protein product [Spodoptera littoralis]CAH1637535.1 unnamed protein product [Spodoptera littoralis]
MKKFIIISTIYFFIILNWK